MKTQTFTVERAFVAGQRTEPVGARNKDLLIRCKNMRPTEYGLAAMKEFQDPLVSPPATSWPYPQIFKGQGQTLLAAEQAIYSVNESTGVLTQQQVYTISSTVAPTIESMSGGNFATTPPNWTNGTGWTVEDGNLRGVTVAGGVGAYQAQAGQSNAIVAGGVYRVTYTLAAVYAGSVRVKIGGTSGATRDTEGVYTEDIVATSAGDIGFEAVATFSGNLDNLSVKRIVPASIPTGGGAWQMADFRGVWFLFKENCVIARLPYYSDFRLVAITSSGDGFTCNSGAAFFNRLFLGGITASSLLATSDFQEAWQTWIENSFEWSDEITYEDMTLNTSTLVYSTRIGGDINWPFVFEMAMLGFDFRSDSQTVAELKANYIDLIRKGEIGFIPLRHQGEIMHIKPLGANLVVYCSDGVSLVTPRGDVGFTSMVIHQSGIASRNAVSGDDGKHLFLDTNSVLWELAADGSMNRACGRGTFDTMVANESTHPIMGSYDPEEEEHYMCSDQDGYIKTRTGIGKCTIFPTSLVVYAEGLVPGGTVDLNQPDIDIETETMDMGLRALKTMQSISFGLDDVTGAKATIRYKYHNSDAWRDSTPYTINSDGVTTPIFTAHDFRVKITGTPGADAKLDYMTIAFQTSDKRNIRSQYE